MFVSANGGRHTAQYLEIDVEDEEEIIPISSDRFSMTS